MITNFKLWLEARERKLEEEIREIWNDTFEALGLGGLEREDALRHSLSSIVYGRGEHSPPNKGKRAVLKRLERAQIFDRLRSLRLPGIEDVIHNVKKWLGDSSEEGYNASTTVSGLLEKLFSFPMDTDGSATAYEVLVGADYYNYKRPKKKKDEEEQTEEENQPSPAEELSGGEMGSMPAPGNMPGEMGDMQGMSGAQDMAAGGMMGQDMMGGGPQGMMGSPPGAGM